MLLFLLILILLLLLTAVSLMLWAYRKTRVVSMPSGVPERLAVAEMITGFSVSGGITELGSGWGGAARFLARCFPEKTVTAVEYSPVPYIISLLLTRLSGLSNVQHRRQDFMKMPLEEGVVYTAYLSGPAMKALGDRFEEEKHRISRSILISVAFAVPGWTPLKIITSGSLIPTPVYGYSFIKRKETEQPIGK